MWLKLCCVLVSSLLLKTEGIQVLPSPAVFSGTGESTSLACMLDTEMVETCVFVRPDGTELCSGGYDGPNCSTDAESNFEFPDTDSECVLYIKSVAETDFGGWTCKAMVWDEWDQGEVELKKFREAEIEFQTLYGDVLLEAGIEQEFSCELITDTGGEEEGTIQWFQVSDGRKRQFDDQPVREEDGGLVSSLFFTAKVEDDGKTISCYNPQSGKDDHITLKVYMYSGPTGPLSPPTVKEGETAEISQTFSSFPPPSSDTVMWHLNLPNGVLVIHPGNEEQNGKYVASSINSLGDNTYSISLYINNVSLDDAILEHSLHIAVADTKNIHLPFQLDVEKADNIAPIVIPTYVEKSTTAFIEEPEKAGINKTVVGAPDDVIVKQESVSVFIIIGIIALCILICILYYCTRCCCRKNQEEEEDIEKNTNRKEETEIKPLIKNEMKNNINVDVNNLNESLEAKLEPEKKQLSAEESVALEETINSLRDVINSPSPLKKEEQSEDQVDKNSSEDKPGIPNLKRVPTLPKDHPSHEEDKALIAKNARILRELTEDARKKDKEEEERQTSKVDLENNTIPINENSTQRKVLSRTSSFEIIRSKTVFMQNGGENEQKMESTTMNIHSSARKEKFGAVELKIQVSPAPNLPGGISYTRIDNTDSSFSLSSSSENVGEENQQLISDSEADSSCLVLADVPVKTNKPTKDSSTGPLTQKPPVPPRTSNPTSPTRTSPEVNGSTLSRSNSITMEAGTQTPKIKARSIVYFDDDISASEESLSDAVAKEELQREIEILKQEVEMAKQKLDNGGSIQNSMGKP